MITKIARSGQIHDISVSFGAGAGGAMLAGSFATRVLVATAAADSLVDTGRLVDRARALPAPPSPGVLTLDDRRRSEDDPCVAVGTNRRTLDQLLDDARARISRFEPADALAAVQDRAVLIDIRSDADRERDGIVPGSLHIPRTVLEWRLDPDGEWRSPYVGGLDQQVILICDHGCSSILAAATLVELGFTRAGDVIGGFAAWSEAGLATAPCPPNRREAGTPAGMRPPDQPL
jgi:rhodanese-related sulfurtransferase